MNLELEDRGVTISLNHFTPIKTTVIRCRNEKHEVLELHLNRDKAIKLYDYLQEAFEI